MTHSNRQGPTPGSLLATLIAGAAGAGVFAAALGAASLQPSNVGWLFNGGIDPSIHFIGAHMHRFAEWSWPPGAVDTLGHPVGTSVALTDSIPIAALAVKTVSPVLPEVFQYFGAWLLACFVLQGVFGALLVRSTTVHAGVAGLGGAVFALSPLLVHRTGHAGLTAHWVLVAALCLAFRPAAEVGGTDRPTSRLVPWLLLGGVTAGIHPYLTAMVAALAAGRFIADVRRLRHVLTAVFIPGLCFAATVWATWWVSGYFVVPAAADLQTGGFGQLSWNPLSPLIPIEGAWFAGALPVRLAGYDQHEGFSYFGLGGWLLLVTGVVAWAAGGRRRPSGPAVGVALACLGLTVFALSPVVTMGERVLIEYPASWWGPLATFRASGRMFWPVHYTFLFAALATIIRAWPPRLVLVVLGLVIGLQVFDLQAVYAARHRGTNAPFSNPQGSPFWRLAFAQYRHVVLRPSNMCAPWEASLDYRFLALAAGPAGATINGGFAARYDTEAVAAYCTHYADEGARAIVRDDTIYVLTPGRESMYAASPVPVACLSVDGLVACVTDASRAAWPEALKVLADGLEGRRLGKLP